MKYALYFRWLIEYECNHWRVWAKYKSEKARQDAYNTLTAKQKYHKRMEFSMEDHHNDASK